MIKHDEQLCGLVMSCRGLVTYLLLLGDDHYSWLDGVWYPIGIYGIPKETSEKTWKNDDQSSGQLNENLMGSNW